MRTIGIRSYALLGGLQLVELAAGMFVFALATSTEAPLRWLLEAPPLLWLGRRSYAIYLWHLPALYLANSALPQAQLTATLIGLAPTVAAAALSFRFLEQPALRLKARLSASRAPVPVAISLAA